MGVRRAWTQARPQHRSIAAACAAALAALLSLAAATSASASVQFVTEWGTAGSADGQLSFPYGLATDSSGDVYVADQGNNRIEAFSPTGTFLRKWGASGSGDGQFNGPYDIAVDASDNVYVTDFLNDRIEKFSSSGTFITKWGGTGSGNGQLDGPEGIATDSSGDVYVADAGNYRVQKFSPSGAFIAKWGGFGYGNGQFTGPTGVATGPAGAVFVTDTSNGPDVDRVEKFTSSGSFLMKWGSHGSANGQFDVPASVAVDASGNVYVVDYDNYRVQEFSASGTFITKWTNSAWDPDQAVNPQGVATDASQNVFVSDSNYDRGYDPRIQKFHVTPPPASVSVAGHTLKVTAAPGASDNIAISRPLPGTLRVSDLASGPYAGSPVHAGAGCAQNGAQAVKCNAGMVTRINVSAGDSSDQVVNSTGIQATLAGGPANDVLTGGWGADTLTGGPGANSLRGKAGADLLQARNLRSDKLIDCGDGPDRAALDKLPLDPNHAVKACETKTRH